MPLRFLIFLLLPALLCGCVSGTGLSSIGDAIKSSARPSDADIVSGLKEALSIGARQGSAALSKNDAFYKSAYKILLPEDAQVIMNNIARIPGGQAKLDDAIMRINRAAESAAETAAPIFTAAISKMSVSDGIGILTGADNAATEYLRKNTRAELVEAYRPSIQAALDEPLVAGVSAQSSWNVLKSSYNSLAASAVGKLTGLEAVQSDLGEYVVGKAVDAMFSQIAVEEASIRANPLEYSSAVIKKVFTYAKNVK